MEKLIEFYEMVSLNDADLRGSEKMAILKARLALNMFKRSMAMFQPGSTQELSQPETNFRMAAS